jgi:hypothetical protein
MKFSIKAGTYTLKYKNQETDNVILDNNRTHYVIPIYQRPYSWSGEQINKFITDIFSSFEEYKNSNNSEPMFIGTMQLSAKDINGRQDIIDGQQRITTFLILLKLLFIKYPDLSGHEKIDFNWLSSEVNNGEQQENLNAIINLNHLPSQEDAILNKYIENLILINKSIQDNIERLGEGEINFEHEIFLKHLLSNIYFVIIETHATLSKTLKIFDAINTTGLDLNAGDIFKIRMYDYLNKNGENKEIFNEISKLYEKINVNNKKFNYQVTDIRGILHIYHHYLVAKYNLPSILYTLSSDTFYDRLFETIFNINKWEHFKNNVENDKVKLSLDEINKIIDIRYEWEEKWNSGNYGKVINMGIMYIWWWWSRYNNSWFIIFNFLYSFENDPNKYEKLYAFVEKLIKIYIVYSINYQKRVNGIYRTFNSKLTSEVVNGNYDSIMNLIETEMHNLNNYSIETFKSIISGNISSNHKTKNILCRLSALLEEEYEIENQEKTKEVRTKLFNTSIDIEHIQSYTDEDIDQRDVILQEWGESLHSLGNLVALEESINRSIKNKETKKLIGYKGSKLSIVNDNVVRIYPEWSLEKCQERKNKEVTKIMSYIFDSPSKNT